MAVILGKEWCDGDHDHSYKLLFAHPLMVRNLLEVFVGGDWFAQVDFDSLERVGDNYISDDLRARADDIVWRFRCGDSHVCLLIEFQSRADTSMAVRVLAYVALLYQDLIRSLSLPRCSGWNSAENTAVSSCSWAIWSRS